MRVRVVTARRSHENMKTRNTSSESARASVLSWPRTTFAALIAGWCAAGLLAATQQNIPYDAADARGSEGVGAGECDRPHGGVRVTWRRPRRNRQGRRGT